MGLAHNTVAYLILLGTCVAGVAHAPWWAVCAGACSLTLLSLLTTRAALVPRLRTISEPILVFSSVLNAAAVASAAYIFGYAARWFWGL
jgi:hypothetical protein